MEFWKDDRGTLAGSKGDRVKAIRLRGIFSQGVLYSLDCSLDGEQHYITAYDNETHTRQQFVKEDSDVAEFLGITKYEPPIPVHMAGEVSGANTEYSFHYDIESIQKYDKVLEIGEDVVVTSKRHGTFCCLAYAPDLNDLEFLNGKFFAASKGLLAKGLLLKNNEANANNVYNKFLHSKNDDGTMMTDILIRISEFFGNQTIYIFGEIFGRGIQDLTYQLEFPRLEIFDIYVGKPNVGRYLNDAELDSVLQNIAGLKRVPILYRWPFNINKMIELRDGNDIIDGQTINQIREGIVIRSSVERKNKWIGRVQLKFISPAYILRKNANATEYQ